jgi:putative transposase
MSQQASPSAGKVYGLERVTRIWDVLGATIYRHREEQVARERPGPLGAMSDQDLVGEIRQLLQASPFNPEKNFGAGGIKNRVVHADARHT